MRLGLGLGLTNIAATGGTLASASVSAPDATISGGFGEDYSYSGSITPTDNYSVAVISGELPPGITAAIVDGQLVFSGTFI